MTTITYIARCPNCKSDWIDLQKTTSDSGPDVYGFHCLNCFHDTQPMATPAEAVALIVWQPVIMYQESNANVDKL